MAEFFNVKEDLISRLTELALANEWVFRGYNIQDQLRPTILRNNVSDVEHELLFEFERYGAQYINVNSPVDFMSYAQHFGLPTRLLDFTYNPFVALYFALFSPKSNGSYKEPEDKDHYYIRYASVKNNLLIKYVPYFNDVPMLEIDSMAQRSISLIKTVNTMYTGKGSSNILFRNKDDMISKFFRSIAVHAEIEDINAYTNECKEKVNTGTILFIDPNQSNQRLVMQQGLFMFPYTLNEVEHQRILDNNSRIIKIHKSLRNDLLAYLDTMGINAFRIMPDLPSVCAAVERKVRDNRNAQSTLFKKKG